MLFHGETDSTVRDVMQAGARLLDARTTRRFFDLGSGVGIPGIFNTLKCVDRYGIPASLAELSVLDISAYSGFFTSEAKPRSASLVVTMDHWGLLDSPNRHDILAGSQPDGAAFTENDDLAYENWSSSDAGRAQVGHHDRMSLDEDAR